MVGRAGKSSTGPLVERKSRHVLLLELLQGRAAGALSERMTTLPEQLRRMLTRDKDMGMREHVQFSVETGIPVHSHDPGSRWQRGTSENTSGLLRQ